MTAIRLGMSGLVCAAVLAGCGGGSTNGPKVTTITVVASRNGNPVDSALVVIWPASDSGTVTVMGTTDEQGRCALLITQAGIYVVEVSRSIGGQVVFGSKSDVDVAAGSTASADVQLNQQQADLFPLTPGNWWEMRDESADTTAVFSVTAGPIANGVLTYRGWDAPGTHPGYFTRGKSAVYMHGYETQTGGEYFFQSPEVLFDFAASVGGSWVVQGWGVTVTLVAKNVEVVVPKGAFTDCYHFRFTGSLSWDGWLAPGVGNVRMERNGTAFVLTNYHVS